MQHYVYSHQADLTLQGAVCPTGYASIYQDGVVCQYFQNSGNFHHLGVLFTIWQIHLLCYITIMQHHSWDKFTYWQCTPCHIRLCQCVYQNNEYYVNYSKYKAWYAFLKWSVDSWQMFSLLKKMQNQYLSSPAHELSHIQMHLIPGWSYFNFQGIMIQETQSTPTVKVQSYSHWRWRRCTDGTLWSASRLREGWSFHHQRHSAQGPWTMHPSFLVWEISHQCLSWCGLDIQEGLNIHGEVWWWWKCGYGRDYP